MRIHFPEPPKIVSAGRAEIIFQLHGENEVNSCHGKNGFQETKFINLTQVLQNDLIQEKELPSNQKASKKAKSKSNQKFKFASKNSTMTQK
jgi:hypothetical protein